MPLLRLVSTIDAPHRLVAGVLRDVDAVAEALARDGHRVAAPARLIAPGDELRFSARIAPGVRVPLRTRVTAMTVDGMESRLVGGPLPELAHSVRLAQTAAGTTVVDELRWRGLPDPVVRRFGRRVQAARAAVLRERVMALRGARVVVATALLRDGRVLAARRAEPSSCAGRWELPGGTVEPGESEPDAVARECREELGTDVVACGRLGTDLPIEVGLLRVYTATLAAGAAPPRAVEHADLRWVGPDALDALPWLDGDRAVLRDLESALRRSSRG